MPDARPLQRRRIIVWALIILAALIALVSSLTVWVKEQLLDTNAWVAASDDVLENDDVRSALSVALTDALFESTDLGAWLQERLPDDLDGLAGPLSGFVRAQAPAAADELLASPPALELWEGINRRVHTRLVALLESDDAVLAERRDLVLDLRPLVAQLAGRLGIEVELPANAGQRTIARSDQLAAARQTVRVVNVLTVFLGLVVLALVALAIYLARGFRREALGGVGASLLLVGVVLLLVRRVVGNEVVESLTSAQTEPAGGAVWLIATDLLQNVAIALVAYGILSIAGAWLGGPARLAVRARRALAPTFRERPVIVFSGVLLAALLALYFGPAGDTRRLFGILGLCGFALVGVEALRRQTLREFPQAAHPSMPPEEPAPPQAPANRR